MPMKLRRVVTGHDATGRAIVTIDEMREKPGLGAAGRHRLRGVDNARLSGRQ